MTTQKEMPKINKLIEIIQKEGTISKVHLVMKSGISLSYYEKLKPFVEEIYSRKVRYDKETKTWHSVISKNFRTRFLILEINAMTKIRLSFIRDKTWIEQQNYAIFERFSICPDPTGLGYRVIPEYEEKPSNNGV